MSGSKPLLMSDVREIVQLLGDTTHRLSGKTLLISDGGS